MKYRFLLIFLITILVTVRGQDTLFLNNERLPVKVIKVSLEDITYKKWSNLDGPEYVISKEAVQAIKYKNGEKDVFKGEVYPSTTSITSAQLRKNAAFVGFGGLNYFISLNYERKLFFTKGMNFFKIKGGIAYFPNLLLSSYKTPKGIFTLASSVTFNLKLDNNNSFELGAGVGYYSVQDSFGYAYVSPIIGYRKETDIGVLFKVYMSLLTVDRRTSTDNNGSSIHTNFEYYPFIGIDVGAVF